MKYGSVCSGIEAASVAWESLGWQAQWYSEIEHFPSEVLAHRFPTVPNLGDMTKLQENEIFNGNSIDLLVGGTPCTSFSVAGLRRGLDDPRGQLMLTFVELAARKRPRWVVWENVPGVLSSNKGGDFASFLGLLTGRDIQAPVGGWTNSGCIEGISSAYGVAWTMLDAQDFGVAQRRKRIFVIGYLGDWRPPAAVLFERNRLQGDTAKSREKRKATPADAQGGVGGGGYPRVSGSLDTQCGGGKLTHQSVNNGHLVPAWWNGEQTAATLTKQNANGAQRMPDKDNFGAVLEPKPHAFKVRGGSEDNTGEQGGTPGKKAGKGVDLGQDEKVFTIGTTQDQQIAQPIAIQGNLIGRDAGGPQGIGVSEDGIMYTQTKADVHGVAQPIVYENHPADSRVKEMGETCQTVSARFGTGGGNVPLVQQPLAVDRYNQTVNEKTSQTIGSSASDVNHYGAVLQPIPYRKTKRAQSKDDHESWVEDEKTNTLNSFDTGDVRTTQAIVQPTIIDRAAFNQGANAQYDIKIEESETMPSLVARGPHGVATNTPLTMAIRRLLPTECEILQGFPRNWTKIPYRKKSADQCPDGPRYKACGNSMAVPCMAYLGRRIQMVQNILDGID
jgi:DNA (cytosine-5)-methyltransferase 1